MKVFSNPKSIWRGPIALLCALSMFFAPLWANGAMMGDVNLDSKVDQVDVDLIMKTATGAQTLTPAQRANADVDKDDDVDSVDAMHVAQIVAGIYKDFIVDTDNDSLADFLDPNDDNDAVDDLYDAFPLDPEEWADADGDGYGDNHHDFDQDNDGLPDRLDGAPHDPLETEDSDGDLIGNNLDPDDDNDGVVDAEDGETINGVWRSLAQDTDGDGFRNEYDIDDDNDGYIDTVEMFPARLANGTLVTDWRKSDPYNAASRPLDGNTADNNNSLVFDPDVDDDGLSNIDEIRIHHTDPLNPDSDGDTYNDGAEVGCSSADPLDGSKPATAGECGFGGLSIASASTGPGVPAAAASYAQAALASASGFETANPDLFSGTFSFSYKLDVPPGRMSLEPNINFSYRSTNPSGWLGMGWAYDPGHIERDTKFGVPRYDFTDVFIYVTTESRTELINTGNQISDISKDPWTGAARGRTLIREYHPKIESEFTTFYYYSDPEPTPVDPEYWVVVAKSGTKIFLGVNTSSRILGPGTKISHWYINRVLDLNGNYSDFSWDQPSAGEIYLRQIDYAGNVNAPAAPTYHIGFTREARPDPTESYRTGGRVAVTQRLSKVTVRIDGYPINPTREYRLAYLTSPASGKSLLSSITTVGYETSGPASLPPMQFAYTQAGGLNWGNSGLNGQWTASLLTLKNKNGIAIFGNKDLMPGVQLADINGDGYTDVAYARGDTINEDRRTWINKMYKGEIGWELAGDSLDLPALLIVHPNKNNGVQLTDVDGDGKADVVRGKDGARQTWLNTFSERPIGGVWTGSWQPTTHYLVPEDLVTQYGTDYHDSGLRWVELNGDGHIDILVARDKAGVVVKSAWLNDPKSQTWVTAAGWTPASAFVTMNNHHGDYVLNNGFMPTDINNDGLTDLLQSLYTDNIRNCWINNGRGFTYSTECTNWLKANPYLFFSDNDRAWAVCGDPDDQDCELDGACYIPHSVGGAIQNLDADINVFPDFVRALEMTNYPTLSGPYSPQPPPNVAPFLENVFPNPYGSGAAVRATVDNLPGVFSVHEYIKCRKNDNPKIYTRIEKSYGYQVVRLDQDALPDFVQSKTELDASQAAVYIGQAVSTQADLLTGIDNGRGGRTDVAYRLSTDIYDNLDRPMNTGLKSPVPVVWRVSRTDSLPVGSPAETYTTWYEYARGRMVDDQFRGFGVAAAIYTVSPDLSTPPYLVTAEGNSLLENRDDIDDLKFSFGSPSSDPMATVSLSYFHQDNYKQGRPFASEVRDYQGRVISRSESVWEVTINPYANYVDQELPAADQIFDRQDDQIPLGVYYISLRSQKSTTCEDGDSGVYDLVCGYRPHQTSVTETFFDSQFDLIGTMMYGDVEQVGDEKSSFTEYNDFIPTPPGLAPAAALFKKPMRVQEFGFMMNADYTALVPNQPTTLLEVKYDARGNTTSETNYSIENPQSSPTGSAEFDPNFGYCVKSFDGNGFATTMTFDPLYHQFPIAVTDAAGHTNAWGFDPRFVIETWGEDPNGGRAETVYDSFGRLLAKKVKVETGAMETIVTRSYALYGVDGSTVNTVTVSMPIYNLKTANPLDGYQISGYNTSTEYYDGLGRAYQTRAISERGGAAATIVAQKFWDARGLLKYETLPHYETPGENPGDPFLARIRYEYDYRGRQVAVTTDYPGDEADATSSTSFLSPFKTRVTDPLGRNRDFLKDVYGNVIAITEYLPGSVMAGGDPGGVGHFDTRLFYDARKNLVQTIDANGNAIQVGYDSLGRKTWLRDPDAGYTRYQYDRAGNLIAQTDAKGQTLFFIYDNLHRLTRKSYSTGQPAITYTYDGPKGQIGKLVQVQDHSGTYSYLYDVLGRATQITSVIDGDTYIAKSFFDPTGTELAKGYPGGEWVRSRFDVHSGLLESVAGDSVYLADITYNDRGQIISKKLGNNVVTDYEYSIDQRVERLHTYNGALNVQDFQYDFDAMGNLNTLIDQSNPAQPEYQQYAYDALDRLTRASYYNALSAVPGQKTNEQSWTYDRVGNIQSKAQNSTVRNYSYGANGAGPHAVTGIDVGGGMVETYTYDANGNMTSGNGRALTWTPDNRLSSITKAGITSNYTYDAAGSRVKKVSGGNTTYYLGSIYEVENGKITKIYFGGAMRLASRNLEQGLIFHHADHLGGASAVTNAAGDTMLQRIKYFPFGETRSEQTSLKLKHKFTGQEEDPESGLYFYNARYYDPALGRFISPDTYVQNPANPQTFNRYTYVANNPLKYVDPSGNLFGIDDFIVALITYAIQAAFAGAIVSGIIAAFTGQDIFQAMAQGFASGFLSGAIGFGLGAAESWLTILKDNSYLKAAVAGGIQEGLRGGNVLEGMEFGVGMNFVQEQMTAIIKNLQESASPGAAPEPKSNNPDPAKSNTEPVKPKPSAAPLKNEVKPIPLSPEEQEYADFWLKKGNPAMENVDSQAGNWVRGSKIVGAVGDAFVPIPVGQIGITIGDAVGDYITTGNINMTTLRNNVGQAFFDLALHNAQILNTGSLPPPPAGNLVNTIR